MVVEPVVVRRMGWELEDNVSCAQKEEGELNILRRRKVIQIVLVHKGDRFACRRPGRICSNCRFDRLDDRPRLLTCDVVHVVVAET